MTGDLRVNQMEMTTIKGTIFSPGMGGAGPSIEKQKRLLRVFVPEISEMRSGTINVRLKSPLSISKFDVETPPIEWEKNRWENFKILRALIQIHTPEYDKPVPCLLYYPSAGGYCNDPFIVEVVTQSLNFKNGDECSIILPFILPAS